MEKLIKKIVKAHRSMELRIFMDNVSIKTLVEVLEVANEAYRNSDSPLMSDEVYDDLEIYLKEQDPKNPFLKKIGTSNNGKFVLPYYAGSLDKIRDDQNGTNEILKWKSRNSGPVVVSDKLDGNSGILVYNGNNINLFSIGNGFEGSDLSGIIDYLDLPNLNGKFVIRGELIISKNNWEKIKHLGTDPRSTLAGCLKKVKREVANYVEFVAFELIQSPMGRLTPKQGLEFLKSEGFTTVYNKVMILDPDEPCEQLTEILIKRRGRSEYDIDGIVVYQNKVNIIVPDKNPSCAFAFKSIKTHEHVVATVTGITWKVSKDGLIKPTVVFSPIKIKGVTISKATGFNASYIMKHDLGPGSKVVIIRSGDVIPVIKEVVKGTKASMPDFDYEWTDSEIDIFTLEETSEQKASLIESFAKKLKIKGIGPSTAIKLVENGIDTIPRFVNVTREKLLNISFKDRGADNILNAIEEALCDCSHLDIMIASNIFGRSLGSSKLKLIVESVPEILEKNSGITVEQIAKIKTIGPKSAEYFIDQLPKFFKLLKKIKITQN
jgi:DNA ligase (NAD+)